MMIKKIVDNEGDGGGWIRGGEKEEMFSDI